MRARLDVETLRERVRAGEDVSISSCASANASARRRRPPVAP
jgi:hypothetical protein